MSPLPTLRLKPHEHHRIADGHLWVFRNELADAPPEELGALVRVESSEGRSLGTGFSNPHSKIAVRMLGADVDDVGVAFFTQRLRQALALRQRLLPDAQAYRVIFGEADLMSGLIIDQYDTTIVMQMLAAGMDVRRDLIIEAIREVMPDVTGIIEKNAVKVREKEGLDLREGVVWGTVPDRVRFEENEVTIDIDLLGGQKTGYFLDQKVNRATIASLSNGKRVLDCFCNVGGFALNAAKGGAREVVGVDSSAAAIEQARHHAEINDLQQCQFEQANVFDLLRQHVDEGRQWDIIILDPPSFAKSRKALKGARAGYAELNRTAMKLLAPGGLLVSASCTQLVPEHDLMDLIYREAARLRKRLRLVHRSGQAPDHPVLLAMPETLYLKFLVFDVVD